MFESIKIAILFKMAMDLTGLAAPIPEVVVYPEKEFCHSINAVDGCKRFIYAYYNHKTRTVYTISEKESSVSGNMWLSFVLHEMIHHIQYHNGNYEPGNCLSRRDAELEAYRLQQIWLSERGLTLKGLPVLGC